MGSPSISTLCASTATFTLYFCSSRHLPFVNSNTSLLAPGMYELASLASFLHRVEPPLDALERLLYAIVAVPGLRASLVDQKGRQPHQKEDVQELRLPVL